MSRIVIPGETTYDEIALQTRAGNDIDNLQHWDINNQEWRELADLRKSYCSEAHVTFYGSEWPVYNCHGLTFASRRTEVTGSTGDVYSILEEDGFTPLPDPVKPQPGDVAVYVDRDGDITHTAIVIELRDGMGPWVWGKWGKGPEAVHYVGVCPYRKLGGSIRYFRITQCNRPTKA